MKQNPQSQALNALNFLYKNVLQINLTPLKSITRAKKKQKLPFVFPSYKRSIDPQTGVEGRHHIHEQSLQRQVKKAVRLSNINKPASCHSFRSTQ